MNYKKDLIPALDFIYPNGFTGFDPKYAWPPADRAGYLEALLPGETAYSEEYLENAAMQRRAYIADMRAHKSNFRNALSVLSKKMINGIKLTNDEINTVLLWLLAINVKETLTKDELTNIESSVITTSKK